MSTTWGINTSRGQWRWLPILGQSPEVQEVPLAFLSFLYSWPSYCSISRLLWCLCSEKAVATHSSVLAWRIPGTGEPGGCRLWGRTESDTTEATQQQQRWLLLFLLILDMGILFTSPSPIYNPQNIKKTPGMFRSYFQVKSEKVIFG